MDEPPLKSPTRHRWLRRLRTLLLTLTFILTLALITLLKIASDGIPRVLLDRLEKRLSSPTLRVELEDVRLTPTHLTLGSVALFSHSNLTPSATIQHATLQYHWHLHKSRLTPSLSNLSLSRIHLLSDDLFASPEDSATPTTPPSLPSLESIPFACDELDAFGFPIQRLRTSLSVAPNSIRLHNLRFRTAPNEQLLGSCAIEFSPDSDTAFSGRLAGSLKPMRVNPLLRAFNLSDIPDIFDDFSLPTLPAKADLQFRFGPGKQFFLANVALQDGRYRGVPFLSASASINVQGLDSGEWAGVHIRNLAVKRPEGRADASLFFDFQRHGLVIEQASSSIDFQHLAQIIDILSEIPWHIYETSGGNYANASGFIAFSAATEPSDLRGNLSAGAFSFRRRVPVQNISTPFLVADNLYQFPDIQGRIYGGECHASASLHYAPNDDLLVECNVSITNASTALLSHDIFRRETPDDEGYANLRTAFSFNASTNTLRSMEGDLDLIVRNARLYQTPLFAGFTDFMARNIPGVDFLVNQDDLTLSATISDNALHFSTLCVEGSLFSITGEGNYWFTNYLDLGVKAHLLRNQTLVGKILKFALYPVSKLFELEVTGPIDNPSWTPTTLTLSSRSKPSDEQKYGTQESN